jgi:hypothetical protein
MNQRYFSALLGGGGYAEYCVIHEDMAMAIPPKLSFEQAACVPEAFLTAWQALRWIGGLEGGKRVLVHAGVKYSISKNFPHVDNSYFRRAVLAVQPFKSQSNSKARKSMPRRQRTN